jgi:hypothetical protein
MSFDVVVRFKSPAPLKALSKTLLALQGFTEGRSGTSWTCDRRADGVHFTVDAEDVAGRWTPQASTLSWSVPWAGTRDEVFVFANAIAEVAEKHAGEVVLTSGDGSSVSAADAFERIVADWVKSSGAVAEALPSLENAGLVPVDDALATRIRVGQLVNQLDDESAYERARERLEELGAAALFLALEHETEGRRKSALEDILADMGESVDALRAKHVALPVLIARLHDKDRRWEAEDALEAIGAPAADALWAALESELDEDRRRTLRAALEEVSGRDSVDEVIARLPVAEIVRLLGTDGDRGVDACESIERLAAAAVEPIFDAYATETSDTRKMDLRNALEDVREAARPHVLALLRDGAPRPRLQLALESVLELTPGVDLLDAYVSRLLAEPDLVDPGEMSYTLERFAKLGKDAVPAILRYGLAQTGEAREDAIHALRTFPDGPEVKEALSRLGANG